jgi:hypothetical protein
MTAPRISFSLTVAAGLLLHLVTAAAAQVQPRQGLPDDLHTRLAAAQARVAQIEGESTDDKHQSEMEVEATRARADMTLVAAEVLRWARAEGVPVEVEVRDLTSPPGIMEQRASPKCESYSVDTASGGKKVCTVTRAWLDEEGRLHCEFHCTYTPPALQRLRVVPRVPRS